MASGFSMTRLWLFSGALLGGIAVAAGAFGAHGLKEVFAASGQAASWETAFRYCLFHSLALLILGLLSATQRAVATSGLLTVAGFSFLVGTLIFSGCLAAFALSSVRLWGAIVPIGGLLLLLGWTCLAVAALRFTPDRGASMRP